MELGLRVKFLQKLYQVDDYLNSSFEGLTPAERRFYWWKTRASASGAITNLLFGFVFWLIGVPEMIYVNIAASLVWVLVLFLLFRKISMSILCSMVVVAPAWLAVHFVGWGAGFQYDLIILPAVALIHLNKRSAMFSHIVLPLTSVVLLYPFYANATPLYDISGNVLTILYTFNLASIFIRLPIITYFFYSKNIETAEQALQEQYKLAENLLHNILPVPVAKRLKEESHTIADSFESVSILFADIVGFTPLSEKLKPQDVVSLLNTLFSRFDTLTEKYSLEKIKTIGDAYMVAAGIPEHKENHAELILDFALEIMSDLAEYNNANNTDIKVRIGINSGPVIAGVMGIKKFSYDLWGDSVNTASRMETSGVPGEIHITSETYKLISDKYTVNKREPIEIKGKGLMQTYFVIKKNTKENN